jgi:hypothetical protein
VKLNIIDLVWRRKKERKKGEEREEGIGRFNNLFLLLLLSLSPKVVLNERR